jgi:hypothetical protein
MTGKNLDRRLSDAFLEILEANSPGWTHQDEIYQYVDQQVKFSEKQLALHIQKAGQIEPNWQHDLRNLQHTIKRNGTVINPERQIWAMPVDQVEIAKVMRHWNDCATAITGSTGNVVSITTNVGQTIERQLFIERVHHLLQCGGLLPKGKMHNWSRIEQALVSISPQLEDRENWIVWTPGFESTGSKGFYVRISDVAVEVSEATARVSAATKLRKNQGKEGWTVSDLLGENPEANLKQEGDSTPFTPPVNDGSTLNNEANEITSDTDTSGELDAAENEAPMEADENESEHNVRYEVCSLDAKFGFHNTSYDEFTNRIDAPPGSNTEYFCPVCGCPFVATTRDTLIFFRHAGGKHLSQRQEFEGWPESKYEPWSTAKTTFDYIQIHNALGEDLTPSVVREKSRKQIRDSLKLNITIGYFIDDLDDRTTLNIWFNNPEEGVGWKIIVDAGGEEDFENEDGQIFRQLPQETSMVTLRSPEGAEHTVNLPPSRLIMNTEDIKSARGFYLAQPQYRDEEATGSMLKQSVESDDSITIGGQHYSTASLDDQYSIRIGLPHFDGRVILPDGMNKLPLVFQEGANWTRTPSHRLRLQTSDLDPFFLPLEQSVILNSERMRREPHVSPRVQVRVPAVSQTIALESYPLKFESIQPSAVVLDVNGKQYPIGNAIEVASKPSSIHLVAQGKSIPLDQHLAKLWYKNHLTESSIQFTEGPLEEVLGTLRGLPEKWFVLSFEMNRSPDVYDRQTIMMKPHPPLKHTDAIWFNELCRQGKRRWQQICSQSRYLETANIRLLQYNKQGVLPEKLKKAVESDFPEMVTWLTNYRRQRE